MSQIPNPESRILHPASRIRKVGIIGEGKLGTGIFIYLLDFGFELVWVCSQEADSEKLVRQLIKRNKRSFDAGIIDHGQYEQRQNTVISTDLNTLHDCDLVIEAIPENLELKKELFARLDGIVQPGAIFASNSSSINPSEIAPAGRTGKFTGIHFFYPVPLKNIVEFTISGNTTGDTITAVESFLHRIQRRFITLDEKNSFLLNRIFLDFQNEAFLMVHAGQCSYLQMDQLVKKNLFPFGIFDFFDSVGLDTMLASIRNYTRDYPHKRYYAPLIDTLSGLVSCGKLGMKTQSGFYNYPMEEIDAEPPVNLAAIVDHLHQTWLSSSKRFTALAHLPIDDANFAIREYFDIERGPFE